MLKLKGIEIAYLKYKVFWSVLTDTLPLLINLSLFHFLQSLLGLGEYIIISW